MSSIEREGASERLAKLHKVGLDPLHHPALWRLIEGLNPEHDPNPESSTRLFAEQYGLDTDPQPPAEQKRSA